MVGNLYFLKMAATISHLMFFHSEILPYPHQEMESNCLPLNLHYPNDPFIQIAWNGRFHLKLKKAMKFLPGSHVPFTERSPLQVRSPIILRPLWFSPQIAAPSGGPQRAQPSVIPPTHWTFQWSWTIQNNHPVAENHWVTSFHAMESWEISQSSLAWILDLPNEIE
jgi:hypothetical protein